MPEETEQALAALAPEGGAATDGAQVFAVGDVEVPDGLQATRVDRQGPGDDRGRGRSRCGLA